MFCNKITNRFHLFILLLVSTVLSSVIFSCTALLPRGFCIQNNMALSKATSQIHLRADLAQIVPDNDDLIKRDESS